MAQKGMAGQVVGGLLIALAAGLAVTAACAMVTATLISGETMAESTTNVMITATLLLGAFVAALIAAGKIKLQRFLMCLAGAGAYYLGLVCCSAILFDGLRDNVGVTALVVTGGGLCAALLGKKRGKAAKYRRSKLRR